MPAKKALLFVWLSFVVIAEFHALSTPMWEGFDEYSHFAMIQHVALQDFLPGPQTNSSEQIRQSLHLVPVSTEVRKQTFGVTVHDDYWRLPEAERHLREQQVRDLPQNLAAIPADPPLKLYEAQQAPLYYWIAAPIYLMIRSFPLPTQVWLLRTFTLLIGSLVIPAAYAAFLGAFESESIALASTAVLALLPQLMFMMFRVSNEALAIVAGSVLFLAAQRFATGVPSVGKTGRFGIAVAFAFLTKAYFVAIAPALVLLVAWVLWKNRTAHRTEALKLFGILLLAGALAGWWYLRALFLTGTVSGEQGISVAANANTPIWSNLGRVPWRREIDFLIRGYVWLGNWSFISTGAWVYRAAETTALLAIAGCLRQWTRAKFQFAKRKDLCLAAVACASFFAGILYHDVASYLSAGGSSLGFYAYCLVVPQVLLLLAGLARLFPRWTACVYVYASTSFAVLGLAGQWFLLLPYYAGISTLISQGRVRRTGLADISNFGWHRFLENLSVNKPAFETPLVLIGMTALYLAATAFLLGTAWRIKRGEQE